MIKSNRLTELLITTNMNLPIYLYVICASFSKINVIDVNKKE